MTQSAAAFFAMRIDVAAALYVMAQRLALPGGNEVHLRPPRLYAH